MKKIQMHYGPNGGYRFCYADGNPLSAEDLERAEKALQEERAEAVRIMEAAPKPAPRFGVAFTLDIPIARGRNRKLSPEERGRIRAQVAMARYFAGMDFT